MENMTQTIANANFYRKKNVTLEWQHILVLVEQELLVHKCRCQGKGHASTRHVAVDSQLLLKHPSKL